MIKRIENGLLEHYKAGTNCLLPSVLFNPSMVKITDTGITIPKDTFISKVFPFKEFSIVINLNYEFKSNNDFILIYLAKDNKKSGIKIENNLLKDYSRFKISKSTSALAIYYQDNNGEWIFVSTFNPPYEFDELGFYGTISFEVNEFIIYKNPFIRFFIDEENIVVNIDGKIINKNDNFALYEHEMLQEEKEVNVLITKESQILAQEKIVATAGDVFFFIEKELYIDGLDLSDFNFTTETNKRLRLVNGGNSEQSNIKIYSTSESSLEILFSSSISGELVSELLIDTLGIGEFIEFNIHIKKIKPMPYHRYNFNILVE